MIPVLWAIKSALPLQQSFGGTAEYAALLQAVASTGLKTQHICLDWLAADYRLGCLQEGALRQQGA